MAVRGTTNQHNNWEIISSILATYQCCQHLSWNTLLPLWYVYEVSHVIVSIEFIIFTPIMLPWEYLVFIWGEGGWNRKVDIILLPIMILWFHHSQGPDYYYTNPALHSPHLQGHTITGGASICIHMVKL